jgi:hypothetical protein
MRVLLRRVSRMMAKMLLLLTSHGQGAAQCCGIENAVAAAAVSCVVAYSRSENNWFKVFQKINSEEFVRKK